MKKFIYFITFIICINIAPLIFAASDGQRVGLEEEILRLNHDLTVAYLKSDIKTLEDMLSKDHVHNNVFGMQMNKRTFLKDIRMGVLRFAKYVTSEIELRVFGDVCVATGIIDAIAYRNNRQVAGQFCFTRIFVKKEGCWKVELFQNTRVVPPPSA